MAQKITLRVGSPLSKRTTSGRLVLAGCYFLFVLLAVEEQRSRCGNARFAVLGADQFATVDITDANFVCGRQKVTGRLDFFAYRTTLCGTFLVTRSTRNSTSGIGAQIPIEKSNPNYRECFDTTAGMNHRFHLTLKTPCGVFSKLGTCCENWFSTQVLTTNFKGNLPSPFDLLAKIRLGEYETKCWSEDEEEEDDDYEQKPEYAICST